MRPGSFQGLAEVGEGHDLEHGASQRVAPDGHAKLAREHVAVVAHEPVLAIAAHGREPADGELLDREQRIVGPPEHVGLGEVVVAEVQPREVLNESVQDAVALLGVAEPPLVVVVDARQHAFEGGVGLFEGG